jgi:hypothetical protein
VIDAVHAPPPDTDDAAVLDGDVQPVAVGVQYRRGLRTTINRKETRRRVPLKMPDGPAGN